MFWCRLGFHKWGAWETIESGHVLIGSLNKEEKCVKVGNYIVLQRTCNQCNYTQSRLCRTEL